IVLLASLVPHPIALTVLRMGAPAALVAAVAAGASGASAGAAAVGAGAGALAVALAFLPETAMPFVNGPAYANERRYPLRPPGPLLVGPLPLAWAAAVVLPASGALLLAARQWVLGGVATAIGVGAAVVAGRSMYALARRWLVFVPAGVVLHDPVTLADPMLFRRRDIRSLSLAPADTDGVDLTAGAFGMALELVASEPVTLAVIEGRSRSASTVKASKLLFTPTRPGAVLTEARERRID
ncbi:MAG TPA: hypothetical protein VM345_14830, partial [Acidimicrobiales bacterium]|nr:hypothetical protein [Acidimicrobiales bacterium]